MVLNVSSNTNFYNKKSQNAERNISFKNAAVMSGLSTFMNLAQNNAAFSTGLTDVVGMVAPRTIIDSYRNKHASVETFRRESTGTVNNNIIPGFVAFGVAAAMMPLMKVKTTIWANSDTMDQLKLAWNQAKLDINKSNPSKEEITRKYVEKVFQGIRARDGVNWNEYPNKNWAEISAKLPKDIKDTLCDPVEKMVKLIENKDLTRKERKEGLKAVQDSIGAVVKGRESLEVVTLDAARKTLKKSVGKDSTGKEIFKDIKIETKLDHLVRDMRDMGEHVFNKHFDDAKIPIEEAIKRIKKSNIIKSAVPLTILCALDFGTQYINRKKTEEATGKKGFVGYKDYGSADLEVKNPNEKKKLNLRKAIGLAALVGLNLVFIGKKNFAKKMEFKDPFPVMDQIKLLFSTTVAGRIVASDDKNELRESCTRDFFSYFNWLILGNFVTKAIVWKDKSLFNFGTFKNKNNEIEQLTAQKIKDEKNPLKKFWLWSHGTSIKTHNEVIDHYRSGAIDKTVKDAKLDSLNKGIGAGLVYSILMLGIGVPLLNMYLTNKKRARELEAKNTQIKSNLSSSQNSFTSKSSINNQLFSAFAK